jgi:hypothetical protein
VLRRRVLSQTHVKSPRVALYYMPALDPREDAVTLLRGLVGLDTEVFAEHAYVRTFVSRLDPTRKVVRCAARGRATDVAVAPDVNGRNEDYYQN